MVPTRFFMALAAAAAALVSCNREEVEMTDPAGHVFRFELVDGETKATLGEEGVFWDIDDKLGVFMGTTHGGARVTEENGKKLITYPALVSTNRMVYAYYPYDASNTDPGSVKVPFPASQQGGSVSAMPMAGIPFEATEGDVNGKVYSLNLGSFIDFRVYSTRYAGERIRSIRMTATSGDHPISGEATLNLLNVARGDEASLALSWQNGSNPSSVTLSQSASVARNKEAAAEGHLYMVVAPGTYSGEISVITNVAEYIFTFEDKEFKRNGLRRFNMDLESSGAVRKAYYVKTDSAGDGGTFLIVYESSSTEAKVFHPVLGENDQYTGQVVTAPITDKGILSTSNVDACQVVLEKVSGTESDYYIKVPSANNNYLYLSSNKLGTKQTATTFTFDDSGNVVLSRTTTSSGWGWGGSYTSTYYLKYSNSNSSFSSSSTASTLALYKPDDGGLKDQYLRFSEDPFVFSARGYTLPTVIIPGGAALSGAKTPVTYSSSDTQVATVETLTGQVTIRGMGTTVITAVAEASDEYKSATASYTLQVVDGFSIENEPVANYIDYVEDHPYTPENFSTVSYVKQFASIKKTNTSERYDWPKPVPVRWTTPVASGDATIDVYYDADHTVPERMANVSFTSSTTANVYSLIPNRDCWYVVRSGDNQIAEGHFQTTGRRRMIKVGDSPSGYDYANNCRDLGGLITTDGRTLRYNRIFRGTNMDGTTDTQKKYLKECMGIGLDVDLREYTGRNPLGVTVSDQVYNAWDGQNGVTNKTKMKITISDILQAVNSGTNVYVHCKVGADRTGFVCLLLESILGVRQDLCDIDYELTSFFAELDGGEYRQRNDNNSSWFYYPKGVNMISGLSGGDFVSIYGDTFQARAINYVVKTLGIDYSMVTAFQNAMLE